MPNKIAGIMNIFFDHQAFTFQNYGGISRYFCELITGINNSSQQKAHLSLLWSNNIHLREYGIGVQSYPFPQRHRLLSKSNNIYNYIDIKFKDYDIYHTTYFNDFITSYIKTKPLITTFYDMTYERLSHQFVDLASDKWIVSQKRKIAQRATHLIAISESTKNDMIDLYGLAPEKITVIHLSSPFSLSNYNNIISNDTIKLSRPYILYVGKRSGYKNFTAFLRAVANIIIRYRIDLICAGGGDFTVDERQLIFSLSISNFVKHKSINDAVLQDLYRNALVFVFPSLYEGFGIPILEAFSCGCPCIASNTSSLPEVAGDAALYIDPTQQESMANAVEEIILNDELRHSLITSGRQQAMKFSWQETVSKTLDLYKTLI